MGVLLFEGIEKSGQDTRPTCADGVSKSCRATVDVDLLMGKLKVSHDCDSTRSECFVDFVQVDIRDSQSSFFEDFGGKVSFRTRLNFSLERLN